MARFINVPTFDIYDEETGEWVEADHWWTEGRTVYQSDLIGEDGLPVRVEVPDRFLTDLASIPKIPPGLRTLLIRNGHHRIAAVVHDYLCQLGLEFPRRLADKIFYEAMKLRGVPRIRRRLMYIAVRLNTERMILTGKARKMEKKDGEQDGA
jgi:hypothetical protein